MQLHTAKLCLDCQEVHEDQHCPVCASESFTYLSRWVPPTATRPRAKPVTSPEAEVYKQLINANEQQNTPSKGRRLLKQGALGLTAVGLLGWMWRNSERARGDRSDQAAPVKTDTKLM